MKSLDPPLSNINAYERVRNDRIAENKKKLQELGIQNIGKSLTSLVDSSNNNEIKKKEVQKTNSSIAKDMNYVLDNTDEEDVPVNVKISEKMENTNIEAKADNSSLRSRIFPEVLSSSGSCGGGGDIAQPVRKKARDSCKSMSLFSSDAEQTLFSNVIWEVAFPMVNNRQATWKTVTLWVRVEEEYRHRAELLNMQPNNQVLNLYPWTKLVKFMKLLKCTCNLGGACQCPKPGDLPEVDGEGEPSASVSWANGVSLGSRETVDLVLLGQVINAVRQLRPSMTEIEYDKAKQAWNKEVMSGNLLNVNDFITEKNLRAKKRMTKVTMKRNFSR